MQQIDRIAIPDIAQLKIQERIRNKPLDVTM